MLVLDRDGAVAAWRRAEGRIYPSVMMNAALYQEYVAVVQGIAEELGDVRSEDELVVAWHERRDLARMVIDRLAPSMAQLMDREAVRDAAFCHRHREVTREHGQGARRAAPRGGQAHRRRVGHVVRRRDPARRPAPGDARPQRAGAAHEHGACRSTARIRRGSSRSCSSTPTTASGCWTSRRCSRPRNSTVKTNGRRASSRPDPPSEVTSSDDPPEEDHRRALPHRRDPAVEVLRPRASREADGLRLQGHEGLHQEPHGRVQDRARARHVELRRADPRAVVRPQRGRPRRGDDARTASSARSGSRSCRATPR